MKKLTLALIALALVAGIVAATSLSLRSAAPSDLQDLTKVVKFSHKFHLHQGVVCRDCHTVVVASESSKDLLIPKMKDCSSCHDVATETECGKCHYDEKPYPTWQKQPREVSFSHKFHIEKQSPECAACHKGIETVVYATNSNLPPMETCTSCHDNLSAPKACESCHTDVAHLYPSSHRVGNFLKEHKKFVRTTPGQGQCVTCHSDNFCVECHSANGLLRTDVTPPTTTSPRSPSLETQKPMILERVHDLNYRMTHGIDARAHFVECSTCHVTQVFCADCHSASGDFARIKPQSHLAPGFTTLGRGSTGGRHADLARKDIKICAACHDQDGRDPVCTLCHTDPDGIKGTHPRTHPGGFMDTTHGDWHENQGSVCYNCHTDPNAHPPSQGGHPGIGFCGYCHGARG